jgi:hypothetical protein
VSDGQRPIEEEKDAKAFRLDGFSALIDEADRFAASSATRATAICR